MGFYLVAADPAAAQGTPRPGVDCSLLTATQAQGLVCATPPQPDPQSIDAGGVVLPADCDPIPNPYTEADRAARCAAWTNTLAPSPAWPTFDVGATYVHPYPSIRMVVLAVGRSLEGIPVVTAQLVAGPDAGSVFAFRVDQGVPWTRAGGQ